MTDNIIQMPTPMNVLADRIRNALERAERSRIEWVEATLDLATTLKEARERFPSNEAFAHWLVDSKLDADIIGHQRWRSHRRGGQAGGIRSRCPRGRVGGDAAQAHRDTASARQAGGRHRRSDGQDANQALCAKARARQ